MRTIDLRIKLFTLSAILLFLSGLTGAAGYFIATKANAFIFLLAIISIGLFFTYSLVNNLLKSINELSTPKVSVIPTVPEKFPTSPEELSFVVHQQATALQETAISLEELSSSFSNKEVVTKIVEMVIEIECKTKLINDIVFQTKLLILNVPIDSQKNGQK